jgi:hypothetical protein
LRFLLNLRALDAAHLVVWPRAALCRCCTSARKSQYVRKLLAAKPSFVDIRYNLARYVLSIAAMNEET